MSKAAVSGVVALVVLGGWISWRIESLQAGTIHERQADGAPEFYADELRSRLEDLSTQVTQLTRLVKNGASAADSADRPERSPLADPVCLSKLSDQLERNRQLISRFQNGLNAQAALDLQLVLLQNPRTNVEALRALASEYAGGGDESRDRVRARLFFHTRSQIADRYGPPQSIQPTGVGCQMWWYRGGDKWCVKIRFQDEAVCDVYCSPTKGH